MKRVKSDSSHVSAELSSVSVIIVKPHIKTTANPLFLARFWAWSTVFFQVVSNRALRRKPVTANLDGLNFALSNEEADMTGRQSTELSSFRDRD